LSTCGREGAASFFAFGAAFAAVDFAAGFSAAVSFFAADRKSVV
jgi:hypothetical protein